MYECGCIKLLGVQNYVNMYIYIQKQKFVVDFALCIFRKPILGFSKISV